MTRWLKNNWDRVLLISIGLIWVVAGNNQADAQYLILGALGNALDFDGTNDSVDLGNSSDIKPGAGDFSVSFWVKTTDTSSFNIVGDRTSTGGSFTSWSIRNRLGKLAMLIEEAGTAFLQYANSGNILDGGWHHYLVTYNFSAGTMKIYVDTVDETTFVNSGGTLVGNDNASSVVLGEFLNGSGDLTGIVDDLVIWKRELSQNDAIDIYNGGVGFFLDPSKTFPTDGGIIGTNLGGLWHHDESAMNTAPGGTDTEDLSGNGNHGTASVGMTDADFIEGIVPLPTFIAVFMRHYRNMRA